jgi:hypothetical protein
LSIGLSGKGKGKVYAESAHDACSPCLHARILAHVSSFFDTAREEM